MSVGAPSPRVLDKVLEKSHLLPEDLALARKPDL
jgi:hypothetical protein